MGSMALVPTPEVLVVPLLGCHKLLQAPLPARLRRVQMSVLLVRPLKLSGRVIRVRTTQITGVVGVLRAFLLCVRADSDPLSV